VRHDRNTIGQSASLRTVPSSRLAMCLLTHSGAPGALYEHLVGHLVSELSPLRLPEPPTPPASPERIDAASYVGTYSCDIADLVVTQDDEGRVWLDQIPKGIAKDFGDTPSHTELVHFRDTTLIAKEPSGGLHRIRAFLDPDATGHATYLHTGRALVYTGS
jgi:hypothetical protein